MKIITRRFGCRLLIAVCLVSMHECAARASEPETSTVFTAGKDGYKSIRIPSVVVTHKGTVLAIAEGRQRKADQAENQLVAKRSDDGGKTWGELKVIGVDGKHSLNNPCTVIDRKSGRIIVMFQSYPVAAGEHSKKLEAGLDGPNIVRNFVITSDDDGATWSTMEDVTKSTKHATEVTTIASGPGIGIQLTRGKHTGRIIIPFNEGPFGQFKVLAVLSDDAGKTWQVGDVPPNCIVPDGKGGQGGQVNEVQMVELQDGSVRLNSRKWIGKPLRKVATSSDGGATGTIGCLYETENMNRIDFARFSLDWLTDGKDAR